MADDKKVKKTKKKKEEEGEAPNYRRFASSCVFYILSNPHIS